MFIWDRSHQTKSIAAFVKAVGLVTAADIYLNYSNFLPRTLQNQNLGEEICSGSHAAEFELVKLG